MNLGTKDYLYVMGQGLLFLAYLFELQLVAFELPAFVRTIGLVSSVVGALVVPLALLQLNRSLSPFPTPRSDAQLIRTGLYKYIRHPVYTGVLLIAFGYALYAESPYKLLVATALLILHYLKSSYEEKLLMEVYADYGAYRKSTGRFFIKLF